MKSWIRLAAALYPRSWREEFGDEFDALLDDVKPRWRVLGNVLGGAVMMQMTNGTNWLKLMAATAVFGAIVAAGASFMVMPRYVSSAVISVTPQPDPVRPVSSQVLERRTAERVAEMEQEILNRTSLAMTVEKFDLYSNELRRGRWDDVLDQMRRDIDIRALPSTDGGLAPIVFRISFDYPDRVKAQAVVQYLATKFNQANTTSNRNRMNVYESFWRDFSDDAGPVPPPPVGETLAVLDPASAPREPVSPNRMAFLASGLGAGLLLGLLAALAMRWPRGMRQLCGFATAGCVIAAAASFRIPSRYTSSAVMQITPTQLTENPLAPPPPMTPAAEFLRRMGPQILSSQNLSKIIQDPRINLYPRERAKGSVEDVVRNMLARDLRVEALDPPLGANAAGSAFRISFSYTDRTKAHDLVQTLITNFQEQNLVKAVTDFQGNDLLREIIQRKGGENLDVLDPPSLLVSPESPNRLLIATIGLGIGLLVGVVTLMLRRPHAPALQPA